MYGGSGTLFRSHGPLFQVTGLKALEQEAPGPEEANLDGSQGKPQEACDLLVGQLFRLAQHEDLPVLGRQGVDGLLETLLGLLCEQRLLRVRRSVGDLSLRSTVLSASPKDRQPPRKRPSPEMAATEVQRDRVDPGVEPRAEAKVLEPGVSLKEGLLGQVLRVRGVAGHPVGEVEDGARVLVDESAEALLVSGKGGSDGLLILRVRRGGVRHARSL